MASATRAAITSMMLPKSNLPVAIMIIIPTDKFMEYAKSIDGSPNTILAAFLLKMIARYYPAKPNDIISGRIA